jgi:ribonuclease HI
MLNTQRKEVLHETALQMIAGKRNVKAKHTKAWRRVAHYLVHCSLYKPQRGQQLPPLETRTLHADILDTMRRRWPANPTAKPRTVIHMLSGVHRRIERQTQAARDIMTSHWGEITSLNKPHISANIRTPCTGEVLQVQATQQTGYAQYLQLQQIRDKLSPAYIQEAFTLSQAYSHTAEQIHTVVGTAQATMRKGRGKRSRRVGDAQQQVTVRWGPCVQPRWQIELQQQALGYKVKSSRPATADDIARHDVEQHRPCEVCAEAAAQTGQSYATCSICSRAYHHHCCSIPEGRQYTCAECTAGEYTVNTLPQQLRLLHVEWHETQEMAASLSLDSCSQEAAEQLQAVLQENADTKTAKRRETTAEPHPTKPQASAQLYDITIGQAIRSKLALHTAAINPHTDISPPGKRVLAVRPVLCLATPGSAEDLRERELACLYEADGRCQRMLVPEAVVRLQQAYNHVKTHHKRVWQELNPGTFEEELYRLTVRYTAGTSIPGTKDECIEDKHQWQMPAALMQALQQTTRCTTERFASPLNLHAGTTRYWSVHKRDQLFGAGYDAYSSQWTGCSVACPNFDIHAATRAVDWAIQSAQCATTPTLTLLLLPTFFAEADDCSYMRLLRRNPDWCLPVFTAAARALSLEPPANAPLATPKHPHWRFRLVAIGNNDGMEQFLPIYDQDWYHEFRTAVREAVQPKNARTNYIQFERVGSFKNMWHEPAAMVDAKWALKATRKFKSLNPDSQTSLELPQICQGQEDAPLTARDLRTAQTLKLTEFKQSLGIAPPLLYDWRQFIYTDGSVLSDPGEGQPGIGAAVYIPGRPAAGQIALTVPISCIHRNDSVDLTCFNTISRAELSALHVALEKGTELHREDGDTVNIATDSLGSMHALLKAIHRPQDMVEHRHRQILQQMAKVVESSTAVIHVWKVKSHIGIVGNELADAAAVAVASGEQTDCWTYDEPSNNRSELHWPYQVEEVVDTSNAAGNAVTRTQFRPVADLMDALRQVVHAVKKLGKSNLDGIYASSWRAIHSSIAHQHSHMFLAGTTITHKTKKLMMQYRWGLLPTRRWLHKCKLAPDISCPLCGEEDGGHHALSACRCVSPTVTTRHNDAGTEIVEAIMKGEKGCSLIMSDVGIRRRRAATELPETLQMCRYVHSADLPSDAPASVRTALSQYTGSVPDAFMFEADIYGGYRCYTIVEIKYCRDTNTAHQETRAHQQHSRLTTLLQEHDPEATVRTVSLMLGVTGVIYKKFLEDMEVRLGVRGAALRALVKRLHYQAANHVQKIWDQRSAQIQGQRQYQDIRTANWSRVKQHQHGSTPQRQRGRNTSAGKTQNCRGQQHQGRKRVNDNTGKEPDHRKKAKTKS